MNINGKSYKRVDTVWGKAPRYPTGVDLEFFTSSGIYFCPQAVNAPASGDWFLMVLEGDISDASARTAWQMAYEAYGSRVYVRSRNGSSWSTWVRIGVSATDSGGTNLTTTTTNTTVRINCDTGDDATIGEATTTNAGILTAADKTKLDGIQAGAQVNPDAAAILSSLLNVDGTTSGLDADLLDGQHASAFALFGHVHGVASTGSDGFMSAGDKTKLDGIQAGAQVNPNAAAILSSLLGVDGTTSGLDADLLDGAHGSTYANPAEVSAAEITAGTEVAMRSYSPANIVSIIDAHVTAREVLTADRTYYVRVGGNDANTGLGNTSGAAFATIQRALDVLGQTDLGRFIATISVDDGAYTISAPLRYRGNQGAQIVLRAANDPTTLPNSTTMTATKATDSNTVRTNHKVTLQPLSNIPLLQMDSQGHIGTIRGILFFNGSGFSAPHVTQTSLLRTSYERCTFFDGSGVTVTSSTALFANCLVAYSLGVGIVASYQSFLELSTCTVYAAGGNGIFITDNSAAHITGTTLTTVNASSYAAVVERASSAQFGTTTFNGGTGGVSVSQSSVRLATCTWLTHSLHMTIAQLGADVRIDSGTATGAVKLFRAEHNGHIRFIGGVPTGATLSPAINTLGNNNGYIS
jgi:hypothetical protein